VKNLFRSVALLLTTLLCASVWAAATPAEAQSVAGAAIGHIKKVGPEQAARDFNTLPDWKNKGINVNLVDMKGLVLASSLNERLVGKNTYESKDPTGKEFVKEFIATVQKGEGWVDYQFINPETKKLEPRSMFVRKVPGFEGFIAVAISK
jgi:cytochrome c